MGLKPGYKQTEVGVIPKEWDCSRVGDLVNQGVIEKPLDGNHGNIHPTSRDFVSYGVPFVMANNIRDGVLDFDTCKFITKERADRLQKGFSVSDDVLLTHKGTIGNTAVVGPLSVEYIMLTPQVTYYRVRDRSRLDNWYLRHYFDSNTFQSLLLNLSGGGTRAYIGITSQLGLPVVMPPLPEQHAIAAALSDVDALIGALDQLVAKKRDLKQAAMQQLLTRKRRLPGFHGEWAVKPFGEIAAPRKERVDPRNVGPQVLCVELEHIAQGSGRLTGSNSADATASLKTVFHVGDVLFGKLRAYLRKYWRADRNGVCSTEIWALVANHRLVTSEFLFHIVKVDQFIETASTAYGTHMPRSDWNVVKNYEVALPNPDEQAAIANVLSDMDAEIAALEARRDKTRALKQGMMQELLTGRIRLV